MKCFKIGSLLKQEFLRDLTIIIFFDVSKLWWRYQSYKQLLYYLSASYMHNFLWGRFCLP
jgi:hypothetical protein